MERILFGDNQFFGINHMSEEKARAQALRFQDINEVIRVLDAAYDAGIRAFMCTTHERIAEVCAHVREHPSQYEGLVFYPCMPYAHKYANALTERGPMDALRLFLPQTGGFRSLLASGLSMAAKDLSAIARMLIDAEMRMFDGLRTPVVFLQNVITDLLLGLGFVEAFDIFADHVRKRYSAEPGFITMNLPRMLDALDLAKIDNPIVCANINKSAFRMSGGREAYEAAIKTRRFRPIAMSILASGALSPDEAVGYIAGLDRIEAVVFGASTLSNIARTTTLLQQHFAPALS